MKINVKVEDHVTPKLKAIMKSLGPQGLTNCHKDCGTAVARLLQNHFTARGGKSFWTRMARATDMIAANEKHALVAVSDYAIFGKIQETTIIKPKGGKKFVSIPIPEAENETKGRRPSAHLIKKTFCIKSKKGNFLIVRREGCGIKPLWLLRESVTLHRDPKALPTDAEYNETIDKAVKNWMGTISRN